MKLEKYLLTTSHRAISAFDQQHPLDLRREFVAVPRHIFVLAVASCCYGAKQK